MWIVPKTLYHFVPDTEGLNLDCEEQAWMFSQSVTWRTKHSVKQTWLRRWKRERWVQHLFGRTLKPSTQNHFVEKWTESLEATHANHSVARESEKGKKTQDTSGPTSENTSEQLDLFGASSRMSKATLPLGCVTSSKTWSEWVTERRGAYSQRRKLARLTSENESSSWPTPTIAEVSGGMRLDQIKSGKWGNVQLREKIALIKEAELNWPTARTSDAEGGPIKTEMTEKGFRSKREKSNQYFGAKLRDAVETHEKWATPQARDHYSAESKVKWEARAKLQAEKGVNLHLPLNTQAHHAMEEEQSGPQDQDKNNTTGKNNGSPKLNPNWVEQLMGLPVGWTQLLTAPTA